MWHCFWGRGRGGRPGGGGGHKLNSMRGTAPVARFLVQLEADGAENIIGVTLCTGLCKLRSQFGIVEFDQFLGWQFVIRRHDFHA